MKLKNNIRLLITCDSGAAAGKTTAAKYLSKKFKLNLLTSGLLYRFVAYQLIKNKKNTAFITQKKLFEVNLNHCAPLPMPGCHAPHDTRALISPTRVATQAASATRGAWRW